VKNAVGILDGFVHALRVSQYTQQKVAEGGLHDTKDGDGSNWSEVLHPCSDSFNHKPGSLG
jgi:hypothetical protein